MAASGRDSSGAGVGMSEVPFFVSAGVESALAEAARVGRDINIAGALYRKVNHGGPAHEQPDLA
jgi:hypothetical protein